MNKKFKNSIALFLVLTFVITLIVPTRVLAADADGVGKLMDSCETIDGATYTISTASQFYVVSDAAPTGSLLQTVQLAQRQFAADGMSLPIVWGAEDWAREGDIVIKLNPASGLGAEAYQLDVASTAAVTASDVDGLLYGLNMLLKHIRTGGTTLQGFTATDAPDTRERAVSLDCGRKYYTKNWICNFIREMSWMGYNTLELHFSDDGGFRLDIWDPAYYTTNYNPENDFSWICGSYVQYWVNDPYRNDPDAGKYLTTAEIIEILQTAKEYHIDVIPSFDSPSHLDYLTWKFEQNYINDNTYTFTHNGQTYNASDVDGCINYTGTTGAAYPDGYQYSTINITGDVAKAFIFQLYSDLADFFKEYADSTDFSIGADEVALYSDAKWSFSDFPGYINTLNRLLNAKGYTVRMFNDFIGTTKYSSNVAFDSNIEIMYWDSPFNPNTGKTSTPTQPASYFVREGRTIYNCIQTHTYYVLRVAGSGTSYPNYDARNPENYNWTVYHSTEDSIYNEWAPSSVSEKGLYSENTPEISKANLGGGYFLIWNDYASLNTEAEVWNGVYDNTGTSSYFYSLLDRMWSNSIKMWNSDINYATNSQGQVTFSEFASIRDQLGDFPGFTNCSVNTALPAAANPTQACLADHSALIAALEGEVEDIYTPETYEAYLEACAAAEAVNARIDATEEEIADAIAAVAAAKAALVLRDIVLTVECKTTVGGTTQIIKTLEYEFTPGTTSSYKLYMEPLTGYRFNRAVGAAYQATASGDGSGFISGIISRDTTIQLWYTNTPDASRLNYLVANGTTNSDIYTEESWTAYADALQAAKSFVISSTTTQADVDRLVNNLTNAQISLVAESETTEIISIEKLTSTASIGKLVGLRVTTTPDVSALTVDGETLSLYTGKVQTMGNGQTVKVWLIGFPADEIGTFTYTISAGTTVTGTVDVTVN